MNDTDCAVKAIIGNAAAKARGFRLHDDYEPDEPDVERDEEDDEVSA